MNRASRFKAAGYITSTASVVLLGVVAWKGAAEEPLLLFCLIAGMIASIVGMELRWRSHRIEQHSKPR